MAEAKLQPAGGNKQTAQGADKRRFARMHMRTAIRFLLLIAVLPSLLVQAGIYYYWLRTSQARELQANAELSRSLATTFDAYIRGLAQHELTLAAAITAKWPYPLADMNALFEAGAKNYPALNAIIFMNLDGQIVASNDLRLLKLPSSKDRDYFQRAIRTKEFVLSDLLEGRADPNPIFIVARGVYKDGQLLGVLAVSVYPDRLGDATQKVLGAEGSASFFDRHGILVYELPFHPMTWNERKSSESGGLLEQALSGHEARGRFRFAGENSDWMGARVPITDLGWVAGSGQSEAALMRPLLRSFFRVVLINFIVVALSSGVAWVISRGMRRSMHRLREHAVAVGEGRLDSVPPMDRISELADLADAFNEMVSMRKQAEGALRESEERLRYLADNVREVFWLGVPDSDKVLFVNKAYEEVWGRTSQSLYDSPRSWLDIVAEEDRPAVVAALGRGVFGEQATSLPVFRIVRPDGTVRWILAWAWPMMDEHGKVYRIAGIAQDITERKAAEEAEAKYRGLVEESLVGVYLIQDGKFLYVNPRLGDIFGYALGEIVVVKGVMDLVADEDRHVVAENMRRRTSGRVKSTHYTFRGLRKDQRIIDVEVIGSATVYGGKPAIVGSLLDITERKQADEELKKMAAELARSNHDLEQFAYLASHDLQEPLRMVAGHLGIVAQRTSGALDESTRKSMDFALDGAVRMQALISDLLAYSRLGKGGKGFVQTDMEASLSSAMDDLKAGIDEAAVTIRRDPLPEVKAERLMMQQLFQNLLGNAIKYRSKDRPSEIHVGARREDKAWTFWVRDNGIGIAPAEFERIFMIFERLHTRQEYPGTGIGLAVCKKIIEHHCGRIWVESRPGEGSTFFFTIPDRP